MKLPLLLTTLFLGANCELIDFQSRQGRHLFCRDREGRLTDCSATQNLLNTGYSSNSGYNTGLRINNGNGYVSWPGMGNGNGFGSGFGMVNGNGYGSGNGMINGNGYGSGNDMINGNGYGSGFGMVNGNGYGSGYGFGRGLSTGIKVGNGYFNIVTGRHAELVCDFLRDSGVQQPLSNVIWRRLDGMGGTSWGGRDDTMGMGMTAGQNGYYASTRVYTQGSRSTLYIRDFRQSDLSRYRCVATVTGNWGNMDQTIYMDVDFFPSPNALY